MQFEIIPVAQYGIDPRTIAAMDYRVRNKGVTAGMNVATFHFGLRGAGKAQQGFKPLAHTLASQGVGYYLDANWGGKQVRTNDSHSEALFYRSDFFTDLRQGDQWPTANVIDWVFTERPACGGAWWGQKRVQGGCADLLNQFDETQRLRKWDNDPNEPEPYAERDDLQITVLCLDLNKDLTFNQNISPAVAAYKKLNSIR
ncbi:hypothetical protein [Nonomuraea glycinis]|uniref:hypothetical protein n=1 Tax=Nonomuraea glycinis TaxID=2047744 RepID=UPI002E0D32AB|nr:hypothetical protein OHA68_40495 [Nonomuraea glycinis]